MLLKKTSLMLFGLLSTATVSLAGNNQAVAQTPTHSDQANQDQAEQNIQVEYVGQIKKSNDNEAKTNVFRVTVPRSFAQIRINPDNPSGHAPWYTDVYLNQVQDDNQHYLGRLFSNAGIQTGIDKSEIPTYRVGKLAQPVYSANQFYFTADDVPQRIILLGQSAPDALDDLSDQYKLQLDVPFVTTVSIDSDIIQKAQDDNPCAKDTCTLKLSPSSADEKNALVNNGADPWGFTIQISDDLEGDQKLDTSYYRDIAFFDNTYTDHHTAKNLITNLHKKVHGNYSDSIMVLPSSAANISSKPYNGEPVYGRTENNASDSKDKKTKGYYAYTTDNGHHITMTAGLLEKGELKQDKTQKLLIKRLSQADETHITKDPLDGGRSKKGKIDLSDSFDTSHDFTVFRILNHDKVDRRKPAKLANPDTNYPNYLVFNDGVYLYDNTTMGICDNSSKDFGPTDADKFFCQDHANYAWGWFSWGVNSQNDKGLDEMYLSDWQFLYPSRPRDYHSHQHKALNNTNFSNSKLVFDIHGYPYRWSHKGLMLKNERHDAVNKKKIRENAEIKNDLPFDLMMFLRDKHKQFTINSPDMRSGFIIPSKGIENLYDEGKINEGDENKKYDLFASINGIYLSLAEWKKYGPYAGVSKFYYEVNPEIIKLHSIGAHQDPFVKDYHVMDIEAYSFNKDGLPNHPILTALNTTGQALDFQLTDGKSEEFQRINWDGGTLDAGQAKVVGFFKDDQPQNEESVHFSVLVGDSKDTATGIINFKGKHHAPDCELTAPKTTCFVKKQADSYPTTYVLDIQKINVKRFDKSHQARLVLHPEWGDKGKKKIVTKHYTLEVDHGDSLEPRHAGIYLKLKDNSQNGKVVWKSYEDPLWPYLQVDHAVLKNDIFAHGSYGTHASATIPEKSDPSGYTIVGGQHGLAVYDKDDNLLWAALP